MPTKPYKTHLLERLQTTEDRVGYLRAAFDEDEATFERAVKDVCESVNFVPATAPPAPVDGDAEVRAVLDMLGNDAVRVREGGGPEDIYASLAVSVAKLQHRVKMLTKSAGQRPAPVDTLRTAATHALEWIAGFPHEQGSNVGALDLSTANRLSDELTAALAAPVPPTDHEARARAVNEIWGKAIAIVKAERADYQRIKNKAVKRGYSPQQEGAAVDAIDVVLAALESARLKIHDFI